MLVLLVGPKGSGKSHIGRLLEDRFGVRFFHVEPLWMRYYAECRRAGRDPVIAEGIAAVHPEIAAALGASGRVSVETTGASPDILAALLALRPAEETVVVRVTAPLDVCLERIAARDQTDQIPMDVDSIPQVYAISQAAVAVTIDNVGLVDADLVALLARVVPPFEIRRATDADLGGICEAHGRAIREACAPFYAPAEIDAWAGRLYPGIHREAIATNDFFVAVEADRLLGFGQLDRATGEVVGCYVHPAALRRRVGTHLLATLERTAHAAGLRELYLDASLNAVAFYRHAGFASSGERRHTLAGGVEIACMRMSKAL